MISWELYDGIVRKHLKMKKVERNHHLTYATQQIVDIPLEIIIQVMTWLELNDAIMICRVLGISENEAYIYYDFKLQD